MMEHYLMFTMFTTYVYSCDKVHLCVRLLVYLQNMFNTKSKLANQTKSKLAKLFPAAHQRPPPHNFDVSAV